MVENISEEELLLRKRARRRLLGAIILVIAAVIILPIIFDDEPKLKKQEIAVYIPSEDSDSNALLSLLPSDKLPNTGAIDEKAEPIEQLPFEPMEPLQDENYTIEDPVEIIVENPIEQSVGPENVVIPKPKPQASKVEIEVEPAAINENPAVSAKEFVIQVGAFSNQAKAEKWQQNLASNGVKAYTEKLMIDNKEIMRVRIGPFLTRSAAENELGKLQQFGLSGVVVAK